MPPRSRSALALAFCSCALLGCQADPAAERGWTSADTQSRALFGLGSREDSLVVAGRYSHIPAEQIIGAEFGVAVGIDDEAAPNGAVLDTRDWDFTFGAYSEYHTGTPFTPIVALGGLWRSHAFEVPIPMAPGEKESGQTSTGGVYGRLGLHYDQEAWFAGVEVRGTQFINDSAGGNPMQWLFVLGGLF